LTTISLPLAVWGEGYAEFFPRWWEGVLSLERQPDEVVIVTDAKNFLTAIESTPQGIPTSVFSFDGEEYADYWNEAISRCSGEWLGICNADDKFLPGALNEIDKADQDGCNLVCDSIQDKDGGGMHRSSWHPETIATAWTMVGAEPMKKSLWQAAGGFRKGFLFADWQLAMCMAKTGQVKAYDATTTRIIYDRGHTRKTLSGVLQDNNKKSEGYVKLRALAEQLQL
jgi:hypothetical protein